MSQHELVLEGRVGMVQQLFPLTLTRDLINGRWDGTTRVGAPPRRYHHLILFQITQVFQNKNLKVV